MSRTTFRFVDHTISHVPEGGLIWEAFCAVQDCPEETSGPKDSEVEAQGWALKHTGKYPDHDLFRRVVSDYARVTRNG